MVLTAMGCGVRTLKSDEVVHLKRELALGEFAVVLVRIQPGPTLAAGLDLVRTAAEEGATVAIVSDTTQDLIFGAAIAKGAVALLPTTEPIADLVDRVLALLGGNGKVEPEEAERLVTMVEKHRAERQGRLMPFEALSRRESEVLRYLMDGMSVNKVAETSFVSVGTVRTQVKAVLRKLGVSSQVAAVSLAYKSGWPEADASLPVDLRFRTGGVSPAPRKKGA